ncbi:Tubulin-specific chaperone A, partial [Lamprotornis superbus]
LEKRIESSILQIVLKTTANKVGELKLAKEKIMYEKEAKQQEEKIEKMKAEACDDYGIKKQIEILQESRMMIPDCQRRLEVAHAELTQLLSKKQAHSEDSTGEKSSDSWEPSEPFFLIRRQNTKTCPILHD